MIYTGKTLDKIAREKSVFHRMCAVYLLQDENDKVGKLVDEEFSLDTILKNHPELRMCEVQFYNTYFNTAVFRVYDKIRGTYRCPKCGCQRFTATALVAQDWVLDKNGVHVATADPNNGVYQAPTENDMWDCAECGHSARGREFRLEEQK